MSESTAAAPAVETAAPSAAPEAAPQAVASTPQTPADATQQPAAPLSRAEARRSVAERGRAVWEAAQQRAADSTPTTDASVTIDATGRAHAPDGTFTTPPDAALAATGTEPAAAPPQPGTTATDPAATAPQYRRIPISETDPLRQQGLEYIDAVDEQQERAIRAALNRDTFRRDVEVARQEAQAAREEALRYRTTLDAYDAWLGSPAGTDVNARYEAMLEVDPEAAEDYRRGAMQRVHNDAEQRYEQASASVEQEQVNQTAHHFVASARQSIVSRLPLEVAALPEFDAAFSLAVGNYGQHVSAREAAGEYVEPNEADLIRFLEGAMVVYPTLRGALSARAAQADAERVRQAEAGRAAELERIRAEAAEQVRRESAEAERQRLAAMQTPVNPLSQLRARGEFTSVQPNIAETASVPIHELRRTMRDSVRQQARAAFAR